MLAARPEQIMSEMRAWNGVLLQHQGGVRNHSGALGNVEITSGINQPSILRSRSPTGKPTDFGRVFSLCPFRPSDALPPTNISVCKPLSKRRVVFLQGSVHFHVCRWGSVYFEPLSPFHEFTGRRPCENHYPLRAALPAPAESAQFRSRGRLRREKGGLRPDLQGEVKQFCIRRVKM